MIADATTTSSPRGQDALPPLSPRARTILVYLAKQGFDLNLLLHQAGFTDTDWDILTTDPVFQLHLQRALDLARVCTTLRAASARITSINELETVAIQSDDLTKTRIAATALLRATTAPLAADPRPTRHTNAPHTHRGPNVPNDSRDRTHDNPPSPAPTHAAHPHTTPTPTPTPAPAPISASHPTAAPAPASPLRELCDSARNSSPTPTPPTAPTQHPARTNTNSAPDPRHSSTPPINPRPPSAPPAPAHLIARSGAPP
ncbi:hypothetical protein PHYC_02523 [Phycisphaerales bacterium]|nr:hypothetical protein PHYC_02523 [Phycisphaerales bacterium]